MISEDASPFLCYDGEREKETIALYGRHDQNARMVETAEPVVQGAEKVITMERGDCALMALCAVLVPPMSVVVVAVAIVGGCALPPSAK